MVGGIAAASGFFQMRAGPPDLAAWFAANGMPPSRLLITGVVQSGVGVVGIVAAQVLGKRNSLSYLLARSFLGLVALDSLGDVARRRASTFDRGDFFELTLNAVLVLVTSVCLVRARRQLESSLDSAQ